MKANQQTEEFPYMAHRFQPTVPFVTEGSYMNAGKIPNAQEYISLNTFPCQQIGY